MDVIIEIGTSTLAGVLGREGENIRTQSPGGAQGRSNSVPAILLAPMVQLGPVNPRPVAVREFLDLLCTHKTK